MRIAVIGPTYPTRGGISHYTTLMVRQLRERHDVLFISFSKQYPRLLFPGRTQEDASEDGLDVENQPLLSFSNPLSWRRAARRVCDFDAQLVIFSWVNPALAVHFRYIAGYLKRHLPRARVVFLCHNVIQHESRLPDRYLTRFAFKPVDHFMVSGEEPKRELLQLVPGAGVSVIGLPTLDFFGRTPSRPQARRELGLGEDDAVVLYFGFVRPYKGLMHLLQAMPEALGRVPSLKLLVVGEFWDGVGSYSSEIQTAGIDRQVTIVDRYVANEEVAKYFNSADIVVLPYVSASASGVIQVAYAFGKPVITTEVGALPEVVEDGRTGYLVPPADPGALARAIRDFFESGRADEFRANVEEYRERFSWGHFVESVEEIASSMGLEGQ